MKDIKLIRSCNDSIIYEYVEDGKHYIKKEILTPVRIQSMYREIEFCKKIKRKFPDFPCVIPMKTEKDNVFIQEYIKGKHYLDLFFTKSQRRIIAKQLISNIDKIEMIDVDKTDIISIGQWKTYLQEKSIERVKSIINHNIIDEEYMDYLLRWVLKNIGNISDNISPVYVHNDLNKENIIIYCDADIISVYFIDFEKFTVADPLKEISKLVWLFRADPELGDVFWEEYSITHMVSKEVLKVYWVFDILLHLEKYNELIQLPGWKKYLEEEIEILTRVTEEDYQIW